MSPPTGTVDRPAARRRAPAGGHARASESEARLPLWRRLRRLELRGTSTGTFWVLLSLVVVLVLFGLVMVLSSSSVVSLDETGSTWSYFVRQSVWALLGTVGLVAFLVLDRSFWRRTCRLWLAITIGLLVAVLIPGVGVSANGSARWIVIGPAQIQPSEFAKLALLLFTADLLARRAHEMDDPLRTFWPVIGVLAAVVLLILAQPNLGTAIIVAAIVFAMLWIAGTRPRHLAMAVTLGAALGVYLILATPFRRARFFAFLNPWADPTDTGYQNIQSLVGLSNGGAVGVGLGASRAKWGFLPYAHTDFIFAIIGEELGFVGACLVVFLFVVLVAAGVGTALRARDRFGTLAATGVTTWLAVQAFVNVGAVIGLGPITGVPLPFVSFGGSSLLVTMCAVGLLLNIARTPRVPAGSTRPARPARPNPAR
jgi:cell division protein FtsW